MAAMAAPAARATAAPMQALPDQMQAPAPERAPMSMIPSIPRFRTPARSVMSSPRQAKRIAVPAATAAASTETMNAGVRISVIAGRRDGETARRRDGKWSRGVEESRRRGGDGSSIHPRNPVTGEDVTTQEEEEDGALQHGSDGGWQAERHLDLISTDGECGQQEGNKHRSEGMQAPEPGDDDRGVAVARRKVALELMANPGDLAHPGQPRQCAGESHHEEDRALRRHAGVESSPRILAHDAYLVSPAGAPEHDPEHEGSQQSKEQPEVDAGRSPVGEPARRRQRGRTGESERLRVSPGTVDEIFAVE